jgi:DNA polymerase-3 subunit epsilon
MSWHTGWMTAFDLETTGVDVETARIVTATIVHIKGSQTESREWLVNPGVPIPAEAAAVHGVTDERAQAEGVPPSQAVAQIFAELDQAWTGQHPVVIFNASYDLTVLDREMRRHLDLNLDGVIGPVIDPFVIDKHLDPYRKGKRTLTATCEHYAVRLDAAHDATQDGWRGGSRPWTRSRSVN